MNPDLDKLQPYPFQKLAALFRGIETPEDRSDIRLSIGEPRHPTPAIIHDAITDNLQSLSGYPLTAGTPALREAIADWLTWRFDLSKDGLNPDTQILPVNGTREALFAFAQCIVDRTAKKPRVLMPNPFYQIYEGAALLAGAEPVFLNCTEEHSFIPDFDAVDAGQWDDCQLLYLCSPGNPTGAVIDEKTLQQLIELAEKHDFIIASDECYSEIYFDEAQPPAGLLGAAARMGNTDFQRCVVFHSLSKRSNAPGLRSGFVAGDASILKKFLLYRTYHGCAMSLMIQQASIAAWRDEEHVRDNRRQYREKFSTVLDILRPVLPLKMPDAGFYFWAKTPVSDTEFARRLFQEQHVTVLPGSYLSRETNGFNPGQNRIRMALVASLTECTEAANRIKQTTELL
ncbi:MAG TPA: succinyldiaminopimelate transaminase [Gammaproteobacteria bacterium]|nr:succinyldiaminopimelate transaminase [Gammaproteobacteria bacterium]